MLAGLFVTLYAVLLPTSASAAEPSTLASDTTTPMILIGTGGLTWSDVSAKGTPALRTFLRDGSSAALSVRSVYTNTCPIDGWLGLSAGNRAAAPGPGKNGSRATTDPCAQIPTVEGGVVPGWDTYVKAANDLKFDSHPGAFGEQLATNGQCVQAIGPGAGVGSAYTSGAVPSYADFDPAQLTGPLARCRVTVVDVGSLRDPDDVAPGEPTPGGSRAEQV